MAVRLYNTLNRGKEEFKPIKPNQVSLYHCGPTVYWTQHIGNLRGMFCADIVARTFRYLGFKVAHVRNYTDVGHLTSDSDEGEDKIAKAALKEKTTPQKISEKYIAEFDRDTKLLNILDPSHKPRATEFIDDMIEMTQSLLDKGFAYATDLAIYFDVSKAKNYTRLSGQSLDDKLKGAGKGKAADPQKKNSADFALWFFKAGQHEHALQYWDSPFQSKLVNHGQGFPGWHIECSVMSNKILGKTIDIHMGGIEHVPVHHTNEIAQSEAANDAEFVHYWLHNEHLLVNSKKMSKSAKTGFSMAQVIAKGFNPLALRYLFLQAHYRSKQNFTWANMKSAQKGYDNLKKDILNLGKGMGKIDADFKKHFTAKLCDDFNTPQALAIVQSLLRSDMPDKDKLATLLDFDSVLGLGLADIDQVKIPQKIVNLANQREKARQDNDWAKADEIREQIESKGYQIEDTESGFKLSPR